MNKYFKLIRRALNANRMKSGKLYYEAHHIVPKSFNKTSTTVLLTPEEHYLAHKYLAEYWKNHSIYGKKMLWAFHRLSYDKGRKLTKKEYGEARRLLMELWTAPKSKKHKENIAKTRRGKKTIVNPETNEIKYIPANDLPDWLLKGWINTNYKKGKKVLVSEEGRKKLAEARRKQQTGKTGLLAKASKGPYTVEFENGKIFTEGSYPELSKSTGLKYSTLQYRLTNFPNEFKKGWKIYKST